MLEGENSVSLHHTSAGLDVKNLFRTAYGSVFKESGRTRAVATVGGATAAATRSRSRTGGALGTGLD